jgi:hypothetical protein
MRFSRTLVTKPARQYRFDSIPIGSYEITAQAPGFATLVRSDVLVAVGHTRRVDSHLTLGKVTNVVTDSGTVATVETDSAPVSGWLPRSRLTN